MEYHSIRISDIVKQINKDYFLPAIQREFVWGSERIEKLFDSIMGDYPIGSFLFWKLEEKNKEQWAIFEFIRDFDKSNPHNPGADLKGINRDIFLVLDGQQRLSSLYIGLKGSYRYFYYRWRKTKLYLNLLKTPIPNENEPQELTYQFAFRETPESDCDTELWYDVGHVLNFDDPEDAKSDMKRTVSHLPESVQENANKLIGKLHNKVHAIPIINYYEERSQVYDKVLTIFVRANSAGMELEYSDLLLSTATAKWKKLNARTEIANFTDYLNGLGTGYGFGKDFVLKASLYLTQELPIQYKVKNFTLANSRKIEDNWENIKTYLATTVRLVAKYGFTRSNIVAPLTLLPIAFFLMKKGNNSFDNSSEQNDVKIQVDIKKWLTIAMLKNAFGGSSDTILKNLRDILVKMTSFNDFPSQQLYSALGITANLSDEEIEELFDCKYNGKYTYLVLSLVYPDRDWKGAIFHEDHIFPAADFNTRNLKKCNIDDKKIELYQSIFNTILNLELLTDTENLSKNATPFSRWISTRDPDFKKRHLIPELDSYCIENFDQFIEQRKKKLFATLRKV